MTNNQLLDFLKSKGVNIELLRFDTRQFYPRDTKPRDLYQVTIAGSTATHRTIYADSFYATERRLFAEQTLKSTARKDFIKAYRLGFTIKGNKKKRLDESELIAALNRRPAILDVLECLQTSPPLRSWWSYAEAFSDPRDTLEYVWDSYNRTIAEWEGCAAAFGIVTVGELNEIKINLKK